MDDRKFLALAAVLLVAAASALLLFQRTPGSYAGAPPAKFTVNGKTFTFTYVAATEAEREAGLMDKKVTDTTTMLFAFPYSSEWQFWMYGTNSTLDIIWVSSTGSSGTVVYVVSSASPCSSLLLCPRYTPPSPADFAIEAKGGFASANGIEVGTPVTFS